MNRKSTNSCDEVISPVTLTILFPNLNEERTLEKCIVSAIKKCRELGISYEILVADNGSSDQSVSIALKHGARVVHVLERGYGAALQSGIQSAQGRFVLQLDSDNTYRLDELNEILNRLEEGFDLVVGDRFGIKSMEVGAMSFLHKRIGNPLLSSVGRLLYDTQVNDFHCGIRAYRRDLIDELGCNLPGMEFASEIIIKASLLGYKTQEFSTKLYADERSGPSHLKTFRDGYRHLRLLLLFSEKKFIFQIATTLWGLAALLFLVPFLMQFKTPISWGNSQLVFISFLGIVALQIAIIDLTRLEKVRLYVSRAKPLIEFSSFRYEKFTLTLIAIMMVGLSGLVQLVSGDKNFSSDSLSLNMSTSFAFLSMVVINSLQLFSYVITLFSDRQIVYSSLVRKKISRPIQ
jgi:glycosyltransferase involved in cell wall biosynthesis